MTQRTRWARGGRLATGLVVLVNVAWAIDPQVKCELLKLKVAAKAARGLTRCEANAASAGGAVDPACVALVDARLVAGFAKADAAGTCGTIGDTAIVQGLIASATANLVVALRPLPTPSACSSFKLRAAGQMAFDLLLAQSRFAKTSSGPFLAQSIARANDTITKEFVKAETALPCATLGDLPTTVETVDGLVSDLLEVIASASRPLAGITILYYNESSTGDLSGVPGVSSGTPYLELGIFLRALGATIHTLASPTTFPVTGASLAPYDLVMLGLTTRVWTPAEVLAVTAFVESGKALLSLDGFSPGDASEVASRNQLVGPFGVTHVLPGITTVGTTIQAHPVTVDVAELRGIDGRPLVVAPPAQTLISQAPTDLLACGVNLGAGLGRMCALFDEWLWLSDSGSFGWDNPGHQALASNIFFWLVQRAP